MLSPGNTYWRVQEELLLFDLTRTCSRANPLAMGKIGETESSAVKPKQRMLMFVQNRPESGGVGVESAGVGRGFAPSPEWC